MTVDLEQGQEILQSQPFSALLGATLLRCDPEMTELLVPLDERVRQHRGAAHGGLVSYAADAAMAFAAGAVVGPAVLTVEIKVNYLRGATGKEILARAMVQNSGSTLTVTRCEVFDRREDGSERLCAVAQGTVMQR